MSMPAILTAGIAGKVRRRWWLPRMIESDLSGLRHRPLVQSQERTADKHVSKRSSDALMLSATREIHSWESSAYCWWEILKLDMIWPRREIYREREEYGSKDGAFRDTRMTIGWSGFSSTDADRLRSIGKVWCEPGQGWTVDTKTGWEAIQ